MKRLMPSGLITFLANNQSVIRADLFVISLPNGQTINATDGQFDITVPSGTSNWSGTTTTFSTSAYGSWSRGTITSEAGFDFSSNTMSLTCVPQQSTTYPGMSGVGILNAAAYSLFDAATVTVQTAYMPIGQYGNVSYGLETKFVGTITSITDIDRVHVEFSAADCNYLLNVKIPTRLIQSNCPWGFCDANCTLSASTFTTSFTSASGTTQTLMIPTSAFSHGAGYYTQGVVKCTSGVNAGLSQTVKLHDSSGHLQLSGRWLLTPNVGDSFTVIAGCDKTMTTCNSFGNLIHFGGDPFVPVPTSAV